MNSQKHNRTGAKRLKLGLRDKIVSIMAISLLAMAGGLVLLFAYQQKKTLITGMEKWGISLALNLAYDSEYGVLVKDKLILDQLLDNIFKEKNITKVEIFDNRGEEIAHFYQSQGHTPSTLTQFSQAYKNWLKQEEYVSRIKSGVLEIVAPVKTQKVKSSDTEWLMDETAESQEGVLGRETIGYVIMEISLKETMANLAHTRNLGIFIIGLASIIFGFLLSRFLNVFIFNPIKVFAHGAEVIAGGNYDQQIAISTTDEIGQLAKVFNLMSKNIKNSHEKIKSYAQNLEDKVKERTAELEHRNQELYQAHEQLKSAQSQLILSEKMASLGVLVSGIAHEINTPISAIANVSMELRNKTGMLVEGIDAMENLNPEELKLIKACLVDFTKNGGERIAGSKKEIDSWKELQQLRQYLADIGVENYREVASVLTKFNLWDKDKIKQYKSILANPQMVHFLEAAGTVQLAQEICTLSTNKITQIVKALKYYAYTDMAKLELVNINKSIENVLVLMHNKFKYRFEIEKKYGDLPDIYCTSEINQVWTNLLSNAHDAVEEMGDNYRGKICVETAEDNNHVVIKISDNGKGVPEDKIDKIFDPFFTTKGISQGVGLGLSIVSGIVKKHEGHIYVESIPGNTTFTVRLLKGGRDNARYKQ